MAFYQSLAYEASAGSGKTFALVIRYISLLYLGARPNTILTLTFTNKAASEMQARISSVLSELHLPKRKNERKAIAETLEVSEEEIIARREAIYRDYLSADLRISTIDTFFARILRLFSQHLGLMPDFIIDDQEDAQRFMLRFLDEIRRADLYRDLVRFSAQERKKMGDIFGLLDDLYAKEAELQNLTFESVPYPSDQSVMQAVGELQMLFDDHCPDLSQRAKNALARSVDIETLQEAKWITKESLDYWDFRKCFIPQMDTLLHTIQARLAEYLAHKERYLLSRYMQLYRIYEETLLQENISSNRLAFNDVTNLLFRLLHEKIDRDFLYFRLDASIDHLLIDEFQDTNIVQYRILEPIIEEIHAGTGSSGLKSFFYVGDIKQSIYRFRGGKKELFHFVQKHYGVTLAQLNTNYRSDCNIVRFVNDTFTGVIDGYTPQACHCDTDRGYIRVETVEDVTDGIVEAVFRLLDLGVPADEIAILTHANADAFEIEEKILARNPHISVTTQTSGLLINNRFVAAVIELMKYLYFGEAICKANFLALIGRPWDDPIDFRLHPRHRDIALLVREIIEHFRLPGTDSNLLKLIEILSAYKDIEAFLFESETLTVESPSKKREGIQIMTIHKSKGLEFRHVIVSDRLTRPGGDRSTFIYDYDGIDLRNIYLRTKGREHVDPRYAEVLEAEKRYRIEDARNALYVAFTRAEHALIVIARDDANSAFAILDLEPCEIGEIEVSPRPAKAQEAIIPEYNPIRLGLQEKKITTEEERADDIHAIQFGNAMHYMLEILDGFDPSDLDNAWWAMQNRFEIYLQDGDAERIRARVMQLLSDQRFLDLVEGTRSKEQSIVYRQELRQLDLLVEKEDRYIVVDYKSGAEIRTEHRRQVRHYREAISEITGKPAEGWLCYIREDGIELVEV